MLPRFAVNRPITVLMVTLAVTTFGLIAVQNLPVDLLPDLSYPTLTIQTEYPDAAPESVEQFVTRPIEEAVGVIPGVREMRSQSRSSLSEIVLEFEWGESMDTAGLDVRERLGLVELPREAEIPRVLRFDPSLEPFMRLGVSGDRDLDELRQLAERWLKPRLEAVVGVAADRAEGGEQVGVVDPDLPGSGAAHRDAVEVHAVGVHAVEFLDLGDDADDVGLAPEFVVGVSAAVGRDDYAVLDLAARPAHPMTSAQAVELDDERPFLLGGVVAREPHRVGLVGVVEFAVVVVDGDGAGPPLLGGQVRGDEQGQDRCGQPRGSSPGDGHSLDHALLQLLEAQFGLAVGLEANHEALAAGGESAACGVEQVGDELDLAGPGHHPSGFAARLLARAALERRGPAGRQFDAPRGHCHSAGFRPPAHPRAAQRVARHPARHRRAQAHIEPGPHGEFVAVASDLVAWALEVEWAEGGLDRPEQFAVRLETEADDGTFGAAVGMSAASGHRASDARQVARVGGLHLVEGDDGLPGEASSAVVEFASEIVVVASHCRGLEAEHQEIGIREVFLAAAIGRSDGQVRGREPQGLGHAGCRRAFDGPSPDARMPGGLGGQVADQGREGFVVQAWRRGDLDQGESARGIAAAEDFGQRQPGEFGLGTEWGARGQGVEEPGSRDVGRHRGQPCPFAPEEPARPDDLDGPQPHGPAVLGQGGIVAGGHGGDEAVEVGAVVAPGGGVEDLGGFGQLGWSLGVEADVAPPLPHWAPLAGPPQLHPHPSLEPRARAVDDSACQLHHRASGGYEQRGFAHRGRHRAEAFEAAGSQLGHLPSLAGGDGDLEGVGGPGADGFRGIERGTNGGGEPATQGPAVQGCLDEAGSHDAQVGLEPCPGGRDGRFGVEVDGCAGGRGVGQLDRLVVFGPRRVGSATPGAVEGEEVGRRGAGRGQTQDEDDGWAASGGHGASGWGPCERAEPFRRTRASRGGLRSSP